jgi:hypothetical protein
MTVVASLIDVVQLAHDLGVPHQEPVKSASGGGGASAIVIVAGVLVSLVVVAGLVWLKKRADGGG